MESVEYQGAWWHRAQDGTLLRFDQATGQWFEWKPGFPGSPPPQFLAGVPPLPPPVMTAPPTPAQTPGVAQSNRGPLVRVGLLIVAVAVVGIAFLALREGEDEQGGSGLSDEISSVLKGAATAQESFATENVGTYTTDLAQLEAQGLIIPFGMDVTIVQGDANGYCIEASDATGATGHIASDFGAPQEGSC